MSSRWKRQRPYQKARFPYTDADAYTFKHKFDVIKKNKCLDVDIKLAALKVAPSIVSLISHSGKNMLSICAGTIIECEESNGTFLSTILTSATLIRTPSGEPVSAGDIKVVVSLSDDKLFEGQVSAFDFHYNIASITIRSDVPLPTAILRHFDVTMLVNPSALRGPGDMAVDSTSFQLCRHVDKATNSKNLFKVCPGDMVVALGRHYKTHDLMAAPGEFSVNCCDFDCEELFMASCKITKSGIGGPLINRYGEVIGINFYDPLYTPFLPINIASKCLDDLKKHGRVRRPWLGVEVTNLYAASVNKLQNIVQKFPSICKGVIVEKVISKSPADCAGICPNDVIVQCSGNDVGCFSEFLGIMWDKAGEYVEVVVLRESAGARLTLTMVADETSPDKYYKWPVPKE